MRLENLNAERALAGLKDFQRRTVDYVFRRMWLDDSPANRFLVADEVGLGKTLVARGIIARTLEHLRGDIGRIDVVYVCSNAAIARQNVNRLNVLGDDHVAMASRLTLLPLELHRLERNAVNFVSFTPGTTFDLKSSGGIWRERVLLHRLLAPEMPELAEPLLHVLRGGVRLDRFKRRVREQSQPLNEELGRGFVHRVRQESDLLRRLSELCERFRNPRTTIPREESSRQFALIGDLRQLLARVCVDALEPDLVILDEFQRFRDLLDGDSTAAELARSVMDYTTPEGNAVRVLLLSATPYKPLTLSTDEEDHYSDFLRTLGFLFNDPAKVSQIEEHLRTYRRGLYEADSVDVDRARSAVERMLRSVMVRTERVGRTVKRDAMLRSTVRDAPVGVDDLEQARLLNEIADSIGAGDSIEYWKSAPHLLQFMKGYQLKRKLEEVADSPPEPVTRALRNHRDGKLSRSQVSRYRDIENANGRLRTLLDEMVEPGQWQLLWMPPALPYTEPGGAYAEVPDFTKALVFSSWNVVPDAISAICSYEVERRMLQRSGTPPRYRDLYTARRPLLKFTESRGRLTGMPALALMYPSVALSRELDPLRLALELGGEQPARQVDVMRAARESITELLLRAGVSLDPGFGPPDQRWYWAAVAVLDRPHLTGMRRWLSKKRGWRGALSGDDDDDKGLRKHIEWFREVADGGLDDELGPVPGDLADVLADLALAGPANCAARALHRVAPGLDYGDPRLSHAAARVAGGFRTLYNLPHTISLLRGDDEDAYWRVTLHHALDGNLQSVLDEFAHQLRESLGLADHDDGAVVEGVAEGIGEALSLRTARVSADDIRVSRSGKLRFNRFRMRTRYALRFGDLRDDQDQTLARAGTVRAAFNSPFRPFILATTSVGQEGLDFHPYCHAVYHWNLPSNPVDLEQREGRVHRYKGHAVRKNVARKWGLRTLHERFEGEGDPWRVLFEAAAEDRPPGANELVPYWIYEVEDGASVERRVPMFPLSRETGKLKRLLRGLAVYRLAFGQPRQEDLLTFLASEAGAENGRVGINLEPPAPASTER